MKTRVVKRWHDAGWRFLYYVERWFEAGTDGEIDWPARWWTWPAKPFGFTTYERPLETPEEACEIARVLAGGGGEDTDVVIAEFGP